jgi:vacuolar-type H+-ATPase subunit I/STV1
MNIDKRVILREIKLYYNIKNDADFARFLGVKPQTLSSWYSRNVFDLELLYAKCVDIDANYLLTGRGEMLRNKTNNQIINSKTRDNIQTGNGSNSYQNIQGDLLIHSDENKRLLEIITEKKHLIGKLRKQIEEKDANLIVKLEEKEKNCREILAQKDELIKSMFDREREIVHNSYTRNQENLERMDKMHAELFEQNKIIAEMSMAISKLLAENK